MLPVKTIKKSNQHQNPNINLEFHNVVGKVLTKILQKIKHQTPYGVQIRKNDLP